MDAILMEFEGVIIQFVTMIGADSPILVQARVKAEVEKIAIENNDINYIDAVLIYCEKNEIEIESVPKLISKPLKEKLKFDAQKLNYMKKTTRAKLLSV